MVLLRRAPALVVDAPRLDDEQQAVLDAQGVAAAGPRGSGHRQDHDGGRAGRRPGAVRRPDARRVPAADLHPAGRRPAARAGHRRGWPGTSTEPLARTHQAFGFGILRREAALRGDDAPRLISGPEQDVILRELLAGHARGDASAPPWPDHVLVALDKRGFRAELRDLLMRAVEHGIEADQLAALGAEHDRPEWVAAAQVLREYDQVTAFSRPGAYDPAWILTAAADRLEDDPEALGARMRRRAARRRRRRPGAHRRRRPAAAGAHVRRAGPRAGRRPGRRCADLPGRRPPDPRHRAGPTSAGPIPPAPSHPLCCCAPHTGSRRRWREVSRHDHHPDRGSRRRPAAVAGAGARRGVASRSPSCGRRRRRRLTSRPGCARPTCSTGSPGARWRWSCAARAATRRCAVSSWPTACPCCRRRARARSATRWPSVHCWRSSTPCSRSRWTPSTGSSRSAPSTSCCHRSGECDAVGLRRLRRLLRREELDSGGERSSDELLAAVLLEPGHAASLGHDAAPLRRLAHAIDAGLDVARTVVPPGEAGEGDDGARTWAPGVSAETVLWAVWDALDIADRWNRLALRGGKRGARADRDLDAVVALFDAAQRYVDRLPAAGPDAFLEHIQGQDVPGDTLAARAQSGDGVALVTPAGCRRTRVALRRGCRRAGGRVAGPAAARLAARLRGAGRRRHRPRTGRSGPRRPRCATTRRGCSSSRCRARRSGCW